MSHERDAIEVLAQLDGTYHAGLGMNVAVATSYLDKYAIVTLTNTQTQEVQNFLILTTPLTGDDSPLDYDIVTNRLRGGKRGKF